MGQKRNPLISVAFALAIIALDQASKEFVMRLLSPGQSVEVVGNLFLLTLVHNVGGVFGTNIGSNTVYIVLTICGLALILLYLRRILPDASANRLVYSAIGLLIGGALGNLIDRLRFAAVTDFLDFGIGTLRWYTFNIADSAILIGICLFLVAEFIYKNAKENRDNSSLDHSGHTAGPLSCAGGDSALAGEDSAPDSGEADNRGREGRQA